MARKLKKRFGAQGKRRRALELAAVVLAALMLGGTGVLEARLFQLSESLSQSRHFISTVIYFGIININVILILLLSFLIFRNVIKLLIDRRRGVLGSRLKIKLVTILVVFALVPTLVLFYVSTGFISRSFDEWFSERVRTTMQETREAGARIYRQDQKRIEGLARIAVEKVNAKRAGWVAGTPAWKLAYRKLDGFEGEYGVKSVMVIDRGGSLIRGSSSRIRRPFPDLFVMSALSRFDEEPGLVSISALEGDERRDIVRGVSPVRDRESGELAGVVVIEEYFETKILSSIETILAGFASLRPGAQIVRVSFLILMVMMVLMILFTAVWLGFYVARTITGPLQSLAEATREIALGNYSISLMPKNDDEIGQLVRSFNQMARDLRQHKLDVEASQARLRSTNFELDQRRRYMEVILRNVNTGVVAVDPFEKVTTVNRAAERILGIDGANATGKPMSEALGPALHKDFWRPVAARIGRHSSFSGQLEVEVAGRMMTLLAEATRIYDDSSEDRGSIVVFDDATEQVKAQRVAAWREVARRIAHEIKNPVTPIKLSAQRMLRRFGDKFSGEDRQVFESCIDTIVVQVDSLRDLVNEFSKFARLPSIRPRMGSVNAVIMDVVNLYRMSYPDVEMVTGSLGELPDIAIDREQLNRVFVNLVSNAIASFEDSGRPARIEFRSRLLADANAVRIEIVDYGCGIPDAIKDRVLEPYFSTRESGTGLGLAIVNQIVSDHGGYVRITDTPGGGTTVVVELPLGRELGSGRLGDVDAVFQD
jgi:two-component system nitrogen regulation sensor histidine kinase NtrY